MSERNKLRETDGERERGIEREEGRGERGERDRERREREERNR